jgi:hypothetical protein
MNINILSNLVGLFAKLQDINRYNIHMPVSSFR